jgi:predicted metal-dependent phosphoesterase TrpH
MNLIDLHIHSTNSDGELSLEQLEQLSVARKLDIVSFTDHNYINNYESDKMIIIKGIELDCEFKETKFHLLLYNFINDSLLSEKIDSLNKQRLMMIKQLLENINTYYKIHINNDKEQIKNKRDIIKWLISNGYGDDPDQVADTYTSRKSICHVQNVNLKIEELSPFIGENTIVSLAHPDSITSDIDYLDRFIQELKKYGLNALEVINLKHNKFSYDELLNLANKNDLIPTFGSDFHRKEDNIGVECEKKYVKELLK